MLVCFVDKFSAHNTMNIRVIIFPRKADGNSVQHDFCDEVEENSASRRFFRSGRMGHIRTQPIEITLDDFSATAENKASLPRRFAARNGLRRAEVKLRQTSDFRAAAI